MFKKIQNVANAIIDTFVVRTEMAGTNKISFAPHELLDEIRCYPDCGKCGYITMWIALFAVVPFTKINKKNE